MSKKSFGTNAFAGLDVSKASHLIAEGALTKSVNTWTDQEGAVTVAKGQRRIYSGYDAISCFAAGRQGGADKLVWMDGDNVYANGANVGTINAGTDMYARDFDDKFYFMGSDDDKNYLYDGAVLRQHGAWNTESRTSGIKIYEGETYTADTAVIYHITSAVNAVVYTATAHGLSSGDSVYITGVENMPQLNGKSYDVVSVINTTSFTIDKDTSDFDDLSYPVTSILVDVQSGYFEVFTPETVPEQTFCTMYDVIGPTQLNGQSLKFTLYGDINGSYRVEDDTTGYPAWISGGRYAVTGSGIMHKNACGLESGEYKWYVTHVMKFSDDKVIESIPYGLNRYNEESPPLDVMAFTVTNTDVIAYKLSAALDFTCSGTIGADYIPGFRLYRTKLNGADYYLEDEMWYGEAGLYVASEALYTGDRYSTKIDTELGAVYLPDPSAHDTPPASSLMALVSQRLFMNDIDNPNLLYFTGLDGTDYVPTLNYLEFPDTITGIGSAGSVAIVFSSDRMWRVSMLGGIPDVDEIETPVGTTYGRVMATTDMGLFFLRDDGLWLTSGHARPEKVSRQAFAKINDPTSISAYGDVLYVADSDTAYVMINRDGGRYWHEHRVQHTLADATNGKFYAAGLTSIYELFAGTQEGAELTTKDWTDYSERQVTRVVIDYDGDDLPSVWVGGNRISDYDGHREESSYTDGGRRLLRASIPRLLNHVVNVTVTMSGNGKLLGVWLESE